MSIEFFNAREINKIYKATVHKNGRLGFNHSASEMMRLSENVAIKIGKSIDFSTTGNLYVLVVDKSNDDAFSISKSGGYFYANTKSLFDFLKYDYSVSQKIIYNIEAENIAGMACFILKMRLLKRDENDDDDEI